MRVKTIRRFIDRAEAMKQREPGDEFECGQERADQLESLGFVEKAVEMAEGPEEEPAEGPEEEPEGESTAGTGEPEQKAPRKESAPAKPKVKEQKAAARQASKNRTSRK